MIDLIPLMAPPKIYMLGGGFAVLAALSLCNPAVPRSVVLGMFPVYAIGTATLVVTLINLRFLSLLAETDVWPLDPLTMLNVHVVAYVILMAPVVWILRRLLRHRSTKKRDDT